MFINEKLLESIGLLTQELRKYLELQKRYICLESCEKFSILLSALLLVLIALILAMAVLLFFTLALVQFLTPMVGALSYSYLLIAAFYLLLILLLYLLRKPLIVNPITSFVARLFNLSAKQS
ncbi:MAG: phage holin family protein [Mediterranea massiliensis]|nr:phage holin family protein [Mediterranea massiliensis]